MPVAEKIRKELGFEERISDFLSFGGDGAVDCTENEMPDENKSEEAICGGENAICAHLV